VVHQIVLILLLLLLLLTLYISTSHLFDSIYSLEILDSILERGRMRELGESSGNSDKLSLSARLLSPRNGPGFRNEGVHGFCRIKRARFWKFLQIYFILNNSKNSHFSLSQFAHTFTPRF